ncbi:MAG: hypothetical protein AB7H66_00870 [Hyphomonadaceae bacterium]
MTTFEFVFALISIITSLAVTHLVSGLIAIVRRGRGVRFSLRHALWSWTAFALVVANWAAFWDSRDIDWPPRMVLIWLAQMIALYAFSSLTVPEVERGEDVDLVAFHESDGKRYIFAHLIFAAVIIAGFAMSLTSFASWLAASGFAWFDLALTAAALVARPIWLQQLIALMLAALASFFMLTRLSVLGA